MSPAKMSTKVQKHTKTGQYLERLNDQLLPLTTRGNYLEECDQLLGRISHFQSALLAQIKILRKQTPICTEQFFSVTPTQVAEETHFIKKIQHEVV